MDSSTLKSEILKLTDQSNDEFIGFPDSTEEAVENWGKLFEIYLDGFFPQSSTIKESILVLKNTLLEINTGGPKVFGLAITAMAQAIAPGISIASGGQLTGTPPIIPLIGLEEVFEQGSKNLLNSEQIAEIISNIIDIWMKTGMYTNNGTGATGNWQ